MMPQKTSLSIQLDAKKLTESLHQWLPHTEWLTTNDLHKPPHLGAPFELFTLLFPARAHRTTSVSDLLRHWLPDYLRASLPSPKCIRMFSTRRCLIDALQGSVDGMTAMLSSEVRIH